MAFRASRGPRLDSYRLRRTVSIDDMVNIKRTLMRVCTVLNNSLYLASGGRVMRKRFGACLRCRSVWMGTVYSAARGAPSRAHVSIHGGAIACSS
jgi:hypothetical protein